MRKFLKLPKLTSSFLGLVASYILMAYLFASEKEEIAMIVFVVYVVFILFFAISFWRKLDELANRFTNKKQKKEIQ